MRDKTHQSGQPRPYVEVPTFGRLFKKNGTYDGKLFHTSDRVTYTFVAGEEVVSLHYDHNRQGLFYKGHSIENTVLSPEQIAQFEQFMKVVEGNEEINSFVPSMRQILEKYEKSR